MSETSKTDPGKDAEVLTVSARKRRKPEITAEDIARQRPDSFVSPGTDDLVREHMKRYAKTLDILGD